jgi:hypothetical protein
MSLLEWDRLGPNARRHHRQGKPGALFIRPIDYTYGKASLDRIVVEDSEHLDRSTNAQNAIIAASLRMSQDLWQYLYT